MVKNIVFDMGGVLVNYSGMPVCRHFIENEEDCRSVHTGVFVSPEWVLLDMGVITDEQALAQMQNRLPQRLHEKAALCMRDWHLYNMQPIEKMGTLLRELKDRGLGIYLCSNAGVRLTEIYRDVLPAADCFDGILFSAEVKCIKPQREMYQHLFKRFSLKPEECFFIDDLQLNIEGARACGMDGYCFADQNIEKLRAALACCI